MKFPDGFIQLQYPGYFWHPESRRVFSLKSGILKPLKLSKMRGVKVGGHVRLTVDPCFEISQRGRSIKLSRHWLTYGSYQSKTQEIQVYDPMQRH